MAGEARTEAGGQAAATSGPHASALGFHPSSELSEEALWSFILCFYLQSLTIFFFFWGLSLHPTQDGVLLSSAIPVPLIKVPGQWCVVCVAGVCGNKNSSPNRASREPLLGWLRGSFLGEHLPPKARPAAFLDL